jgi:uncharacterized protein
MRMSSWSSTPAVVMAFSFRTVPIVSPAADAVLMQHRLEATSRFIARPRVPYCRPMLFVIHCVDRPNSGEVRRGNREAHLAYLAQFDVAVAGPLLDEPGDMCGSCLILDVDDRAAAEAYVAGDPYTRAGLFDRVEIHGFRQVVGAPLSP